MGKDKLSQMLEDTQTVMESLSFDTRAQLLSVLAMMCSCYKKPKNHAVFVFVEDEEESYTMTFNATPEEAQHILAHVLPAMAQAEKECTPKGEVH